MLNQKGNLSILVAILVCLLILGGGFFYYSKTSSTNPNTQTGITQSPIVTHTPIPSQTVSSDPTPSIDIHNECTLASEIANYWTVTNSSKTGICEISEIAEKDVVTFSYPNLWQAGGGGGASTAYLGFVNKSDPNSRVLRFLPYSTNAKKLEDVEKSSILYESSKSPILGENESVISKEIKTLGKNQTLVLHTEKDNTISTRYFILRGIMYEFITTQTDTKLVEEVVSSFKIEN